MRKKATPKKTGLVIAKTFKRLRTASGFTQEEMAALLGMKDKSSISNIENGKTSLGIDRLELFARAVGMEPVALLMTVLQEQYPEFVAGPYGEIISELSKSVVTESTDGKKSSRRAKA